MKRRQMKKTAAAVSNYQIHRFHSLPNIFSALCSAESLISRQDAHITARMNFIDGWTVYYLSFPINARPELKTFSSMGSVEPKENDFDLIKIFTRK